LVLGQQQCWKFASARRNVGISCLWKLAFEHRILKTPCLHYFKVKCLMLSGDGHGL
jgi:hypothetical protein